MLGADTLLGNTGRWVSRMARGIFYLGAFSSECVALAIRPRSWTVPVKERLLRQILFGGVEAIPFTMFTGLVIGLILTVNSFQWLEFTGRLEFLGPALSVVVIRETAPFFACVIIIAASASAITTEVANMRVAGEIDLIEAQGINLIQFLVMPRMIGLAIAATGLATVFVATAFAAAAIGILLIGRIPPGPFFDSIFGALSPSDFVNLIGRSALPAFLIGAICCYEGLSVTGPITAVPQAVTRAMLRSVAATLLVSAAAVILTYL